MPSKGPSAKYLARARALADAVDLAAAVRATLEGHERTDAEHDLLCKEKALAPDPVFANLRSLAYLEDAFFTYWNESSGDHIERFWQLVTERGLPFQRKDIVRDVLKRGRINNEIEHQTITDAMLIQQQTGKISPAEAAKLSKMLGQFEERASKRHRSR